MSPEGNMTLMTTAQIGDWDYGTTGDPKDLFVTGDVHIGKTNGSLFVNGDIDVRHRAGAPCACCGPLRHACLPWLTSPLLLSCPTAGQHVVRRLGRF